LPDPGEKACLVAGFFLSVRQVSAMSFSLTVVLYLCTESNFMQLYFIDPVPLDVPCTVTLGNEESFHCIKVLRMRTGDALHLTDGAGNLYEGQLLGQDTKNCPVMLLSVLAESGKRPFRLHMAVAPTKNIARFEWFLEKATEIGVDEITPLICEHSERVQIRTDRLQKIILSAAKQSLKTYLPILHEPMKFDDFIRLNHPPSRFVAYVEEHQPLHLKTAYREGDCTVLIGPEGDFSKKEMETAIGQGFNAVSLGPSRLRTETAAVVACHIINIVNES
jgi:16S rRNA (uracil1498-N3)-methyltransferase